MNEDVKQLVMWILLSIAIPAFLLWVDVFSLKGAAIVVVIAILTNVHNYCDKN